MRQVVVVVAAAVLFTACGGNKNDTSDTRGPVETPTGAVSSTIVGDARAVAMWPAPDITFPTPEAAARDFVSKVFDVPPTLGTFRAGDARSGEIDVLSPGEGGTDPVERGTLVLRQLGPKSGWFVISGGSRGASITNLSTGDNVRPGKLTVQGQARGFEGNVVVRAYVAGDDVELSKAVTQAGSMADTAPYRVTLDLGGAEPGEVVFIVVRGGVGLETDPGEFAAIPVVVA